MFGIFKKNGLSGKTSKEIERLSLAGNRLLDERDFTGAYNHFIEALELLPDPKSKWSEATWLFAALGDVYFLSQGYSQALQAFTDAMHCPGALGNPFLHLRLGQCQLEAGNLDRAADELARAYMGAGLGIFQQDDPKYFEFLKTRLKPPANGVW
jgi:tetratricopeptide (TPR) repeat protein